MLKRPRPSSHLLQHNLCRASQLLVSLWQAARGLLLLPERGGILPGLRNCSQKLSLIPIICARILLDSPVGRRFRREQIEIERDIYNGLFHTAFSQSRNNRDDPRYERRDHRCLFATTLSMIIVRNESF